MSSRSASWPRPAETALPWLAGFAALVVLLAAWTAIHHGFYTGSQIVDTPVYERYGNAVLDGSVPYRDFGLEYPPGALPVFVAPALVDAPAAEDGDFRAAFETIMLVCAAAALALAAAVLTALRAPPGRLAAALLLIALTPLALGSVVLTRFDLLPAALTVGALAALVSGRHRLGFAVLAIGAAVKVYPAVLLPLALAFAWKRLGRREALVGGAVFAGVLAACFIPFVLVSPDGVWDSVLRQTTRPLQIESLGAAVLLALHQVGGLGLTMESSNGSQNLAGTGSTVVAAIQSILQAGVFVAIWCAFDLGARERECLVRFAASAVCDFVACVKVL